MKKLQLLFLSFAIVISGSLFAQTQKTETFEVSGNCGMCKKTIEKAAKDAGATIANWDKTAKTITVSFAPDSTDAGKIQKKIAEAGYDNIGSRASDDAYNKLHGCCKYERKASKGGDEAAVSCCDKKEGACKDAKSVKKTKKK